MRRLHALLALMLISLGLRAEVPKSVVCQGQDLSRADLVAILKDRVRTLGKDPKILDDEKRTRIEVDTADCDYLVRVTTLPEKPGGFTIYRISRAKHIVSILPGE